MPVELVEVGTSAGVGILDNVLVELEERGIITGRATYVKDGLRIAGALGGLAVSSFLARPGSTVDKVAGALGLSALPLAMHSVRRLVKKALRYAPRTEVVLERVGTAQPQVQVAAAIPAFRPAVITSY
jgi:hypothetical protein